MIEKTDPKGNTKTLSKLKVNSAGRVFESLDRALKHGLPERFILESVQPSCSAAFRNITIYKTDTFYRQIKTVPADLNLVEVPKKTAADIQKAFNTYIKANIGQKIEGFYQYIGADPEIFIEDENGNPIPAFMFLKSIKNPNKTDPPSGNRQNLYWDGFAAEFTVEPNTCLAYVVDSIRLGLKKTLELAKVYNPKAKLSIKNVIELTPETLQNTDKEFLEFGCKPSFNVYDIKPVSLDWKVIPYRSTGGHMHFGNGKNDSNTTIRMVKALDTLLGVCCVSMFENFDDPVRREYYGQAGEYRLPPHGLEYRTLSNAWIYHPAISNLVWDLGRMALQVGKQNLLNYFSFKEQEVIDIIQSCDVKAARKIMKKNKDQIISLLKKSYDTQDSELGYKAFFEGIESVIQDPTDVAKNWNLTTSWVSHCESPGKNWNHACNKILKGEKV